MGQSSGGSMLIYLNKLSDAAAVAAKVGQPVLVTYTKVWATPPADVTFLSAIFADGSVMQVNLGNTTVHSTDVLAAFPGAIELAGGMAHGYGERNLECNGSYSDFKAIVDRLGPASILIYSVDPSTSLATDFCVRVLGDFTIRGPLGTGVAEATVLADFPAAIKVEQNSYFT